MTTEKLLDRVRKLLALAESPNLNEAAQAAARAQSLITQHRLQGLLDAHDQAEELDDGRSRPLEDARKIRKWKAVLAAGLARANGCRAYTVALSRRHQLLCVAGHPHDQEAVHALWEWLVKRLEWLSASAGPGQDRDWHESFRIGAAETITERLQAAGASERGAVEAEPGALLRLDAALVEREQAVERFAQARLGLKPGRGIRVREDGLQAGRKAGAEVPLPDHRCSSTGYGE